MRIITRLALAFFLSFYFSIDARSQDSAQVTIGSTVPDFELQDVVNYTKSKVNLSEFRGQLLILDFWASWCAPCIAAFPKMDSLQKEYKDKLRFILLSNEKLETVKKLYKQVQVSSPISLISAYDSNSLISTRFDVRFVPHYVWIDAHGIIRAITESNQITRHNIEIFVSGGQLNLPVKIDEQRINLDYSKPLLSDSSLVDKVEILNYSLLTKYINGTPAMFSLPWLTDGKYAWRRIYGTKKTIAGLYQLAYGNGYKYHRFPYNRTILNVSMESKYRPSSFLPDSVRTKHLYCYDLIISVPDSAQLYRTMQADLDRYFGLNAQIEKRVVKCLILTLNDSTKLKSAKDIPEIEHNQFHVKLTNQPVSAFAEILYDYLKTSEFLDVVDETGLTRNITLEVNTNIRDISSLKRELMGQGITLSEGFRKVEVLVLSEKSGNL